MRGTSTIKKSSPMKTAKVNASQNCAGAAKRVAEQTPPTAKKLNARLRIEHTKPDDSPLRIASCYAIQTYLNSKLGSQCQILPNVKSRNTRFALRPSAGNADALNKKLETVDQFGTALIEKASPWTPYMSENIPRFCGTINQKHAILPRTSFEQGHNGCCSHTS